MCNHRGIIDIPFTYKRYPSQYRSKSSIPFKRRQERTLVFKWVLNPKEITGQSLLIRFSLLRERIVLTRVKKTWTRMIMKSLREKSFFGNRVGLEKIDNEKEMEWTWMTTTKETKSGMKSCGKLNSIL
jgi:hypothetical protein